MFRNAHRVATFGIALACIATAFGQTPAVVSEAITIQGQIRSETIDLAGTVDFYFEFTLWDDDAAGDQKGFVMLDPVPVEDGIFKATLDFGLSIPEFKFTDVQYYLEICARPSALEEVDCDTMTPRIGFTKTPYASISGYVELGKEQEGEKSETLWNLRNVGLGGAARFEVLNALSTAVSLYSAGNGAGETCMIVATGTGSGVRVNKSGPGNAALFSVLDVSNASEAVKVSTVGSGAALRATAGSGIGLLAESTSGVGLQASSLAGTALDVQGTSAFSGTADFNHALPFRVTSSALISNLNAEKLGSQTSTFYTNASNLTAGTLPSGRLGGTYPSAVSFTNSSNVFSGNGAGLTMLSAGNLAGTLPNACLSGSYSGQVTLSNPSNVLSGDGAGLTSLNAGNLSSGIVPDIVLASTIARTNVAQTFSVPQTFTGATVSTALPSPALSVTNSGIGRAASFTASSITAALSVSNSGGGRAAEFTGNVHTSALYTQAYTVGTANRATPVAYGSYSVVNGLSAHTPNVLSVTWEAGPARYVIDLGESYNVLDYVTTVTPVVTGGGSPIVATSSANLGKLVVRIFGLDGTAGTGDFHFVVYKP